jgi:hypothetical protein
VKLELELEATRVAAGERVTGRVRVLEGGPSRSLSVTLSFHERTRDYSATPMSTGTVVHDGELAGGQAFDFAFILPPDAPPSFRGGQSELWWELEAHSDERGLDTFARRRVEVVPRRDAADPVHATFTCALCGAEAGVIRVHAGGGRTEIRRESWPSVLILPRSPEALGPYEELIASRDVRALFELEFELTPFYCPSCDAVYCSDHWDWWVVWDDEWVGWRDSVRGRCPQGHERMLED